MLLVVVYSEMNKDLYLKRLYNYAKQTFTSAEYRQVCKYNNQITKIL